MTRNYNKLMKTLLSESKHPFFELKIFTVSAVDIDVRCVF